MSKEAIQAVVHELESLPDTDQGLVLTFVAKLRQQRRATNVVSAGNQSALAMKDGLPVFTGRFEGLDKDWVQVAREEHDDALMQAALGQTTRP